MASSNNSKISFLEGRNVFIFDTETTGLPDRVPGAKWGSAGEYWPYHMNEKYASARIVSIAWTLVRSWDKDILEAEYCKTGEQSKIKEYIRYPAGFDEIPTTHIHGISIEQARRDGVPLLDIFENCGLADALETADYIIGHNVIFDIHILENELYRLGCDRAMALIQRLEGMKAIGRAICTGELGKDICQLEFKSRDGRDTARVKRFKMPKLRELHLHLWGAEHDDQHSASGDVLAVIKCLSKM